MMTLYVYDTQTESELVATITRESNAACEALADEYYPDTDRYGPTYSPTFGAVDGLVDNAEAEDL